MFQFAFGQFSGEQQHGVQTQILQLKSEDRLAHGFCVVDFPWDGGQMPRRGVSAETLGPR